MKTIPLTRGLFTVVDDEWFDYLNQFRWQAMKYGKGDRIRYYAKRTIYYPNKVKFSVFMHQVIRFDVPIGMITDHIDNNSLNNSWDNLRAATRSQNNSNRSAKQNSKGGYLGVSVKVTKNKNGTVSTFYTANIKHNHVRHYISQHRDPIDAAKAYDKRAFELKGGFERLNFPEDYKKNPPTI